jgi:hypothetical protein
VPGGGRASVYAHTAELDERMKSRDVPGLDASTEDSEEADPLESSNTNEDLADDAAPVNLPLPDPPGKQPFLRSRLLLAFGVLLLFVFFGMAISPWRFEPHTPGHPSGCLLCLGGAGQGPINPLRRLFLIRRRSCLTTSTSRADTNGISELRIA